MFFIITALLTLIISPLMFIVGKPVRLTTVRGVTPQDFHEDHKMARLTPVVIVEPWEWMSRLLVRKRIAGLAIFGIVIMNVNDDEVLFHEAVHVAHQSMLTPPLFVLIYLLDWLAYLPFKRHFRVRAERYIPVAEIVAYKVANDRVPLAE